jgi:ketosteroid isomerase-like protein
MKGELMKTQRKSLLARVFVALVLCGVIVFSGFQVFGQEWTDVQKEVWNSVKASWEYFKQGDLEGFMTTYHDDAVEWWRNKAIPLDKATMKLNFKGWLDYDKPISYELEPLSIKIFGNVANVFYTVKWKGDILSDYGRHMQTWIKQDNKWKFISGMNASCDKPLNCK